MYRKRSLYLEYIKQRNSSIELLRIVCMFMIVIHHIATHGNYSFELQCVTATKLWHSFINMGGKIGVDTFIIISGYFLINSKPSINIRKIFKLEGQILFYSILCFCCYLYLFSSNTY